MAATDAKPIPLKATAYHAVFPILDADGDLVTGAASLDSEFSENGATFADCASEATEIATSSGMYALDLASTEMDGDVVAVIVKTSTAGAKTTPMVFYPQESGDIKVDLQSIAGSAVSTTTAQLGVNVVNAAGTAWNSGAIGATTLAADTITAAKIATDAIGASKLAADAVAEIADGVWDEAMSGHLTLGTYGQVMRAQGLTGEVNDVAATTTSFAVDGFTEVTAGHFNGSVIVFTSGVCAGQSRVITNYSATTQIVTLAEALTDAPADNDDIVIIPGSVFIGGTLAQIARLFITILNTDGTLDNGSFTAGAIDANALAADAVTEIWAKAIAAPTAAPAATATALESLAWLLTLARNKITQTATTQTLRNDGDTGNIATAAVSDDGTTATRAKWA